MKDLTKKSQAIQLRKEGKSYSQILKDINVSKSTLSLWLRSYPLSPVRMKELRDWNEDRIMHYKETRRKRKEKLLADILKKQQKTIFPLFKRDLFIGGLFLYWGEGSKTKFSWCAVSNTDPAMIYFFVRWFEFYWGIDKKKMKIRLHLYQDMSIKKEINFWSKYLSISQEQFRKPSIKKTFLKSRTYKVGFSHGTCNLIIGNANLTKEILMAIKALQIHFIGSGQ